MNDALKELAQQLKAYKAPFFFLQKERKQALATKLASNLLYDIEQLQRIDSSAEFCETAAIFYQKYVRWKKIKAEVTEVGGDLEKYVNSFFKNFVELFKQKLQQFYSDLHKRLEHVAQNLRDKNLSSNQRKQVNAILHHFTLGLDDQVTMSSRSLVAKLYLIQGSSAFVSEEILESIGKDLELAKSYHFLKNDLAALQEELSLLEHFVSLSNAEQKDFLNFLDPPLDFMVLLQWLKKAEDNVTLDEVIAVFTREYENLMQRAQKLIPIQSYKDKAKQNIAMILNNLKMAQHKKVSEEARKQKEETKQHFKSDFFVSPDDSLFEGKDFYNVLKVNPDASQDDIRKAYRKAALRCHPDKYPDREEEFKWLGEAYDVLNDPQKRAWYDKYLKNHPLPSSSNQNIVKR